LQGEPAAPYDFSRLGPLEQAFFGPRLTVPWIYPPTFLLLILPLGLLPYGVSLGLWLAVTAVGYLYVIRRMAPHPLALWLTLAFPGTMHNILHGQNGFLSAALLGGGLLLVDRAPVAAGVLLGILSYKPHLLVLIPAALICGKQWRALAALAASAALLALASLVILGLEPWQAFWDNRSVPVAILESGQAIRHLMPTTFAGVLLAGGEVAWARLLQGIVTAAALGGMAWAWRRQAPLPLRGSVLVLTILLATPYLLEYDLTLLALPLAWLGYLGYREGWLPGERGGLIAAWFLPGIFPGPAKAWGVPLAPFILVFLFYLALRRLSQARQIPE
jgi:hypothetical protein